MSGPDKGYTGQTPADAAAQAGIELEIVSGPKPVRRFVPTTPVVAELTNRWINRRRCLVRQYESTLTAHEAFVILSQIRLLLQRLDRHGYLFDKLKDDTSLPCQSMASHFMVSSWKHS